MDESTALSLLGSIEYKDPRLYSLLELLIKDFYTLNRQVNPVETNFGVSGIQIPAQGTVTGFTATIFPTNLRLTWDNLEGIGYYEIRYLYGANPASSWDLANNILRTSTTTADLNPISIPLVYGNHTFFIKATDTNGIASGTASIIVVNIPQIPASTLTPTIIDNFVLLKWSVPTSVLQIEHYNVYKDGVQIGEMDGTFEAIFETTSGTYTYSVEAQDIVGNIGIRTSVTAFVNQPPDFELSDVRISNFPGTKVNTVVVGNALLANVDTAETFAEHFVNNGWDDVQDQIDAGYPYHHQPTETTGSYEEIIDYGTVVSNTIVTLTWSVFEISPSVSIVAKIASSEDGIGYTTFTEASSLFVQSLRYVKIRFEFTGTDDDASILFSLLQIRLDVKREMDSGQVTALKADGLTGTQVLFNKAFKDVDSITLTVAAQQPITAIYNFVDIPNPTFFHVLAFDSSGNQVDFLVSWKARGVV